MVASRLKEFWGHLPPTAKGFTNAVLGGAGVGGAMGGATFVMSKLGSTSSLHSPEQAGFAEREISRRQSRPHSQTASPHGSHPGLYRNHHGRS